MTKVVHRSLQSVKPARITSKRVVGSDGQRVTVRTIDANSPTFGEDLLLAFRLNVRKARQENKRVTGSADYAPPRR